MLYLGMSGPFVTLGRAIHMKKDSIHILPGWTTKDKRWRLQILCSMAGSEESNLYEKESIHVLAVTTGTGGGACWN